MIARRTGVATAERRLEVAAARLTSGDATAEAAYGEALDRLVALGGGDLDARAGRRHACSGWASTSTGPLPACRAARRRAPRWRASSCRGSTCWRWTSRPATSTSTAWSAWSGSSQTSGAASSADQRGTHALQAKVQQAKRHLERADDAAKPVEPWELRLTLAHARQTGARLAELAGAVAVLGTTRIGPIDLAIAPGDRVAIAGRNGSGKTTALRMLLGVVVVSHDRRCLARIAPDREIVLDREGTPRETS